MDTNQNGGGIFEDQDAQDVVLSEIKTPWSWFYHFLLDDYGASMGAEAIAAYMALLRFAQGKGECFPAYKAIRERTGMSRNKVIAALARLEELKLIKIIPRSEEGLGQTSNKYILLAYKPMPKAPAPETPEKVKKLDKSPSKAPAKQAAPAPAPVQAELALTPSQPGISPVPPQDAPRPTTGPEVKEPKKEEVNKKIHGASSPWALTRPAEISARDYYQDQLVKIQDGLAVIGPEGKKKNKTGIFCELIDDILGGGYARKDPAAVAVLVKQIGTIWAAYEFIFKQAGKDIKGNRVEFLMGAWKEEKARKDAQNGYKKAQAAPQAPEVTHNQVQKAADRKKGFFQDMGLSVNQ